MYINQKPDTEYRNCFDENEGDCPYMVINKYGTECCSIDHIVQVKWYGCTPQEIIDKVANKKSQLNYV